MEENIFLHHIGARNGARGFPVTPRFEKDFVSVMYDADEGCLEQVQDRNSHLQSSLIVLPYCVAETKRKGLFHLNKDPYTSSIYMLNEDWRDVCYYRGKGDYLLKDTFTTEKTLEMEFISLDIASTENSIPAIDFISIDVQGAELDILKGGEVSLEKTLAIEVETEFLDLYKGQALFPEVFNFLSQNKFFWTGHSGLQRGTPFLQPIGLRGEGIPLSADQLFIRNPHYIFNLDIPKEEKYLLLNKHSFISFCLSQFELSAESIKLGNRLGVKKAPLTTNYLKFNEKWYQYIESLNVFGERYHLTLEEAQRNFYTNMEPIKKDPFFIRLKRLIKRVVNRMERRIDNLKNRRSNEFENYLKKIGFTEQSKTLHERRLNYL